MPRMPATSGPFSRSFVLHERAREYYWEGAGALSIKSFYHGRADYRTVGGQAAVDDGSYLILNAGQPYSISIEAEQPVESLCVFFASGLAERVHRGLIGRAEALLDDPDAPGPPTRFYDRTYPHDTTLSPALQALRASLPQRRGEAGWLEEQMHGLMERLLAVHHGLRAEVAALPAVRAATREELYRRLHRARDYAAACFDQPLTLDDLAQAAALSPNHLLRTFRAAFGQTPHQYLTRLRLARAREMITNTDVPVTEVCLAVGFESLSSFSSLFRRAYGLAPSHLRQLERASQ
jgi:AraC-like DNA-binding protein